MPYIIKPDNTSWQNGIVHIFKSQEYQRGTRSSLCWDTKNCAYLLHANGIAITFIVQAAEDAHKALQELHDEVSCLHSLEESGKCSDNWRYPGCFGHSACFLLKAGLRFWILWDFRITAGWLLTCNMPKIVIDTKTSVCPLHSHFSVWLLAFESCIILVFDGGIQCSYINTESVWTCFCQGRDDHSISHLPHGTMNADSERHVIRQVGHSDFYTT